LVLLLTSLCGAAIVATASAQAPAQPQAPPPVYAPPYPAQPIYAPAPYAIPPPQFALEQPGRRARAPRPPYRTLAWRVLFELGGSPPEAGRAVPSVDGQRIAREDSVRTARELRGVFDLRLTMQRLFGEWFGLGLQLGLANWQSTYLNHLEHPRSSYLSLAVLPEARVKLGFQCRHCVSLVAGVRLGALLSIPGEYRQKGWSYAESELGSGGLWGAHGGLEMRLGERWSMRLLGAYEGAVVRNRVDYGRFGSEQISFRLDRGLLTFGFAVGLL
jgi:hypothetical protein